MKKVDLPHYGLFGIHKTGANGIFDFLRSDKKNESREAQADSRLDYQERSGQSRRDNRFERGEIRREGRLVKAENKVNNVLDGGRTKAGKIVDGFFDLFKPKDNYNDYPISNYPQTAQISTTQKSNQMGNWILVGGLVLSGIAGSIYFNKKGDKPKSRK